MFAMLFSFRGKLGRVPYVLVTTAALAIFGLIQMFLWRFSMEVAPSLGAWGFGLFPLLLLSFLAALWIMIAAGVKRLRDIGVSGALVLLYFVILPLAILVLAVWPPRAPTALQN